MINNIIISNVSMSKRCDHQGKIIDGLCYKIIERPLFKLIFNIKSTALRKDNVTVNLAQEFLGITGKSDV
jgi:hypothetical protein